MRDEIRGTLRWEIPTERTINPEDLAQTILEDRAYPDVSLDAFLHPDYDSLGDPSGLPDIDKAVSHIQSLQGTDKEVVIYGDYDIDGMTATALLCDVLSGAGLNVRPYIPDRFVEGYGLHDEALAQLAAEGVDTVITVDCGSTGAEQVSRATQAGLHVIVTDHHTLGTDPLTDAVAHINPLRPESHYPESRLAGVGVAFGLARALQKADPKFLAPGQEKWLLDLVALGTICDVVPLQGENRVLARFGLEVLRRTRRPGLMALAQIAAVDLYLIRGDDVGFKLGPRLNAAGRLEHAKQALELIMARDTTETAKIAEKLQALNIKRQGQTADILAEARIQAAQQDAYGCLVVADPGWSHGVVGLVASRLAEEFRKPAFVLQIEGETSKGSGRSIGGFRLVDALRSQDELLVRYGGHAAAAGLTMKTENIDRLRDGLDAYIRSQNAETSFNTVVTADLWLQANFLSDTGLDQLSKLEPFGNSHSHPLFYVEGEVVSLRPVGADGQHYQLVIEGSTGRLRTIAFGAAQNWPWLEVGSEVALMLKINPSVWQGVTRPDSVVSHLRQRGEV